MTITPAIIISGKGARMNAKDFFADRLPAFTKGVNRSNVIIALVALAIILNALFSHLVLSRNGLRELIEPGNRLPDFSMKLTDGREISNRDFLGKPAVYFFFANWCPCAHLSVKFVKRAFEENRGRNVSIYGVGIQDSQVRYGDFAKKHGVLFPVADRGGDGFAESMGIRTTPTLVFVDDKGIIRFYFMGKVERYEQVEKGLHAIMEAAPGGKGVILSNGEGALSGKGFFVASE